MAGVPLPFPKCHPIFFEKNFEFCQEALVIPPKTHRRCSQIGVTIYADTNELLRANVWFGRCPHDGIKIGGIIALITPSSLAYGGTGAGE